MDRPLDHVPHLHFHHDGDGYQYNRQDVLEDNEDFAEPHLAVMAKCTPHHINGFVIRCIQCG